MSKLNLMLDALRDIILSLEEWKRDYAEVNPVKDITDKAFDMLLTAADRMDRGGEQEP